MTNGQIAQLQDLIKCHNMPRGDRGFVLIWLTPFWSSDAKMNKWEKGWLRRLTHQYRYQIAAMKKNRKASK